MKEMKIVITEADYARLQRLIESSRQFRKRDAVHLDELEEEIDRATIVKAGDLPYNVVTMNSRVRIKDLDCGREVAYQVVFPADADVAKNRISVLAPIGTALLGCSVGMTVQWRVPSGLRRLRILEVEYQPEAASVAA